MITRFKPAYGLGLAVAVLLSLTLLAACGATPPPETQDNKFDASNYTNLTPLLPLQNDQKFKDKVLVSDSTTVPETVTTFSTTASLADVKAYYTSQMQTLGWLDRSSAIIDQNALGTDAWALGFEKSTPTGTTPAVTHVVGLYMFNANSDALKDFKADLPVATTTPQYVLIRVDGTSLSATTPAK